jgi:hypothetical protein
MELPPYSALTLRRGRCVSRFHVLRIVLSFAATVAGGHASAQWSTDPLAGVSVCADDSSQTGPRIVGDGTDGAIIVWEDARESGSVADIYAQRLSGAGVPRWQTNGIPVCTAPGIQRRPEIVSDGTGGAIVVWEDGRNGSFDIFAQRIDNAGAMRWQINGVPICTAAWAQQFPAIISDGTGGAIMTWQDSRVAGYAVYAQRINAVGSVQWAQNGIVVCDYGSSQLFPRIASDGRSGAIIAWEDGRLPSSGRDVYAQLINSDGFPQWQPNGVPICLASNHQQAIQLIPDGLSGAIIVWQDLRIGSMNSDIYAQRVNQSGVMQWITNGISVCIATGEQFSPRVITDQNGGAIIAWIDGRYGYAPRVFAQRINGSGSAQWQTSCIDICPSARNVERMQLAVDGSGGALFAWQDRRSGANNINIYAQRIDVTGTRDSHWPPGGLVVNAASGDQTDPQLLAPLGRKAIVVWCDMRSENTASDIYASAVYCDSAALIPVTFLSFTASVLSDGVLLSWRTANESNIAAFVVQRSIDELSWQDLGSVNPSHGTSGDNGYSYVDPVSFTPASTRLLYRISEQDYDGATHNSPIVVVAASDADARVTTISMAPNPAHAAADVNLMLARDERIAVSIRDLSGRIVGVVVQDQEIRAGRTLMPISLESLSPGTYFMELTTSAGRKICKFVLF